MGKERDVSTKDKTINEKEDDNMTALAQYLTTNRENAYAIATMNTRYNEQGRPVISKDDEWIQETEWDDLFSLLSNKKAGKDANE